MQTKFCVYRVHRSMDCILISSNRREGRCWQRLEDRWWWVVGLRTGRIGGWVVGLISSLQLWRRNKLIWQWQMNHLLFPNCQFYASQTRFSPSVSSLFSHHFLLEHPQPHIFFLLAYQALFQPQFLLSYIFSLFFCSPHDAISFLCHQLPYPILFLLCCWRSIDDFCIWRVPAAFYYVVISADYLSHLIDRLILVDNNYFSASVSCQWGDLHGI